MKQLIVFLLIITTLQAFGTATDSDCDCIPKELPQGDGVNFISKMSQDLTENTVQTLANELCSVIQNARVISNYSVADNVEARLVRYGNIDKNSKDYKLQIAEFWNKYSDRMICSADNGRYPRQHVFKRAIEMNIQQEFFMDYFLTDEVKFPINVNAVEIYDNGTRSTVLDYIDAVLAREDARERYNVGQIVGIKKVFEQLYGGKRAREL